MHFQTVLEHDRNISMRAVGSGVVKIDKCKHRTLGQSADCSLVEVTFNKCCCFVFMIMGIVIIMYE